jgi:hypothetical protein
MKESVWKTKNEKKNETSPTGNRTPASRVTGGDTDHYTIEDLSHLNIHSMCSMNTRNLSKTRHHNQYKI